MATKTTKRSTTKKAASKTTAKKAKTTTAKSKARVKKKTTAKKATTKKTTTKTTVKKTAAKKSSAKKTTTKKAASKKTVAKKTPTKKTVSKTTSKKTITKKTPVKKTAAKKTRSTSSTTSTTTKSKIKKSSITKPEPKATENKTAAKKKSTVSKTTTKVPVTEQPKAPVKKLTASKKAASNVVDIRKAVALTKSKKAAQAQQLNPKLKLQATALDLPPEPNPGLNVQPSIASTIGVVGIKPYEPDANETFMNPRMLEHFNHILTTWKSSLMAEVDRTVHHMQDEAANFPDPNDRATQEEEFSLALRTRDRERKLLNKINKALNKIVRDDEYGYCETCGIEIGLRRLEARPTAELCIDCKTLEEIKEKQNGK